MKKRSPMPKGPRAGVGVLGEGQCSGPSPPARGSGEASTVSSPNLKFGAT